MGKFDGYLICSDIDGTIEFGAEYEKFTPNFEAVKYFTQNGGRFTFTTGRYLSYLRTPRFASVMNAPGCTFNGTVIYDYSKEKLLFNQKLPFTNREILDKITPFKPVIKKVNCCCDIDAGISAVYDFEQSEESMARHSMKIVCSMESVDAALEFKRFLEAEPMLQSCYINRAWNVGVEIVPNDATKGQAIDFIKNYLGDIHTSIGIGDYENDLPLIQHADIGVAVGDAVEVTKNAADIIVKPCREFAMVDLIEKLDNGEIKKQA